MPDFIQNGQGHGSVAETLMANNFDTGALRPWSVVGADGGERSFVTLNTANGPQAFVTNAPTALRKDAWLELDRAVIAAAKPRLSAVADLRAAGLQRVIPNGLGVTSLEYEAQSDIGDASLSMDGIRQGDADRPVYDLRALPLPIIHKDFYFSARQLAASRRSGSPLDTTNAELAARKVAEEAEKLQIGESTAYNFGGSNVYGYKTFPQRLTKTLTEPDGTNNDTVVTEVLEMRSQSTDNNYFGPWVLYFSKDWAPFMDADYSSSKGDNTLRQRLQDIQGIQQVKQLDYLTGNELILVQMTSDVVQTVIGMDVTTLQWPSHGGMQLNFKVMAIMVPRLRYDYNDQTGIVHGTYTPS